MDPPIYFIHLSRRHDRLEAAKAKFDPDLWSRRRQVEAFDGRLPRDQLLDRLRALGGRPFPNWVITNASDPVLFRRPGTGVPYEGRLGTLHVPYNARWYMQPQTVGSVACGVSHHEAWRAVAEAPEPWAVILEDDQALPSAAVFRRFVADVDALGGFDVAYLFKMPAALTGPENKSNPRMLPLQWQFGAQAYAVSKAFAATLVELNILQCLTVPDEFMNWAYNPHGHPRREQWERCFGRPQPGKRAFVYVGKETVVDHLKTPSDLQHKDPAADAEAKATVVWLEEQLSEVQPSALAGGSTDVWVFIVASAICVWFIFIARRRNIYRHALRGVVGHGASHSA